MFRCATFLEDPPAGSRIDHWPEVRRFLASRRRRLGGRALANRRPRQLGRTVCVHHGTGLHCRVPQDCRRIDRMSFCITPHTRRIQKPAVLCPLENPGRKRGAGGWGHPTARKPRPTAQTPAPLAVDPNGRPNAGCIGHHLDPRRWRRLGDFRKRAARLRNVRWARHLARTRNGRQATERAENPCRDPHVARFMKARRLALRRIRHALNLSFLQRLPRPAALPLRVSTFRGRSRRMRHRPRGSIGGGHDRHLRRPRAASSGGPRRSGHGRIPEVSRPLSGVRL